MHANEIAIARFLANGHRLVRYEAGEPYSWLRPGEEPKPIVPGPDTLRNGSVAARWVEALKTHGMAESTRVSAGPYTAPPNEQIHVEIAEATHECVRLFGTALTAPKRNN